MLQRLLVFQTVETELSMLPRNERIIILLITMGVVVLVLLTQIGFVWEEILRILIHVLLALMVFILILLKSHASPDEEMDSEQEKKDEMIIIPSQVMGAVQLVQSKILMSVKEEPQRLLMSVRHVIKTIFLILSKMNVFLNLSLMSKMKQLVLLLFSIF